jgi:hypothetical protein
MLTASWWVATPDFDVDTFLMEMDFTPDDVWHRGEQPKWTTSGFRVEFDEQEPFDALLSTLKGSLSELRPVIEALHERRLASTLTIAFSVGGRKVFARSICMPPDFLFLLADLGVQLEVSAFPTSDD